jgi:hypothetical protein
MVTSQDNKVIEGRLLKKTSLKDSPAIEVGETLSIHYFDKPEIGENFMFYVTDRLGLNPVFQQIEFIPFQTTKVTKIIDEFTFETKNSVYYLIDKARERDFKIEDLLK